MNVMDLVLCIPLVWGLYKGFTKGLLIELASLIAFAAGLWAAHHFSDYTTEIFKDKLKIHSPYLPIIAFSLTTLLVITAIFLLAKLIQKLVEGVALGMVNKIAGALFGCLKYALLMSIFIFVLNMIDEKIPFVPSNVKKNSLLYNPIGRIVPFVIPQLNDLKLRN